MNWKVISTETFSKQFRKHRKDGEFVKALDNKIKRLGLDPENMGEICRENFMDINQQEF
jgi:hypothetical protein